MNTPEGRAAWRREWRGEVPSKADIPGCTPLALLTLLVGVLCRYVLFLMLTFFSFLLPLLHRRHHRRSHQQPACTARGVGNGVHFPPSLFPAPLAIPTCAALLPGPFRAGAGLSGMARSRCARQRRVGPGGVSLVNVQGTCTEWPVSGCWLHAAQLLGPFSTTRDGKLQSEEAYRAAKTGFHRPQHLLWPGTRTDAAASF